MIVTIFYSLHLDRPSHDMQKKLYVLYIAYYGEGKVDAAAFHM